MLGSYSHAHFVQSTSHLLHPQRRCLSGSSAATKRHEHAASRLGVVRALIQWARPVRHLECHSGGPLGEEVGIQFQRHQICRLDKRTSFPLGIHLVERPHSGSALLEQHFTYVLEQLSPICAFPRDQQCPGKRDIISMQVCAREGADVLVCILRRCNQCVFDFDL